MVVNVWWGGPLCLVLAHVMLSQYTVYRPYTYPFCEVTILRAMMANAKVMVAAKMIMAMMATMVAAEMMAKMMGATKMIMAMMATMVTAKMMAKMTGATKMMAKMMVTMKMMAASAIPGKRSRILSCHSYGMVEARALLRFVGFAADVDLDLHHCRFFPEPTF